MQKSQKKASFKNLAALASSAASAGQSKPIEALPEAVEPVNYQQQPKVQQECVDYLSFNFNAFDLHTCVIFFIFIKLF